MASHANPQLTGLDSPFSVFWIVASGSREHPYQCQTLDLRCARELMQAARPTGAQGERRMTRFNLYRLLATGLGGALTVSACGDPANSDQSNAQSGTAADSHCLTSSLEVRPSDLAATSDDDPTPEHALVVTGAFAGTGFFDVNGPFSDPAEVDELVGRPVHFVMTGLDSGAGLVMFDSRQDLEDVACAIRSIAEADSVVVQRAKWVVDR